MFLSPFTQDSLAILLKRSGYVPEEFWGPLICALTMSQKIGDISRLPKPSPKKFSSLTKTHSASNLGFIFDEHLTFSDQICTLSKSCYFHIRELRCISQHHCYLHCPF